MPQGNFRRPYRLIKSTDKQLVQPTRSGGAAFVSAAHSQAACSEPHDAKALVQFDLATITRMGERAVVL